VRSLALGGYFATPSSCHFEELRRFEVKVIVGLRKKKKIGFFVREREGWMDGLMEREWKDLMST